MMSHFTLNILQCNLYKAPHKGLARLVTALLVCDINEGASKQKVHFSKGKEECVRSLKRDMLLIE